MGKKPKSAPVSLAEKLHTKCINKHKKQLINTNQENEKNQVLSA